MTSVSYKMKLIVINCLLGIMSIYFILDGSINSIYGQSFWLAGICLGFLSLFFYIYILRPVDIFCENYFDSVFGTLDRIVKNFTRLSKNGTEYLSNNSKEQELLLEQDSVLAELNFNIEKTLKNADESLSYMNKSKNMSEEGKRVLDGLKEAMDGIRGAASALEEIISVIGDINQKTKIINEIVFETKLLSFNASIEAARAGQYGKGFAVVAQEIGNLALMSGKASLGISSLLENSTNQVKELGTFIQEKIKDGERSADECKRVFIEIADGLPTTLSSLDMVFGLMRKQQMEMEKIVSNIAKLDQMIKKDGMSTKEINLAVTELNKDASELSENVTYMNDFFSMNIALEEDPNNFNKFDDDTDGDIVRTKKGDYKKEDFIVGNNEKFNSSENVNGLAEIKEEMNNIEEHLDAKISEKEVVGYSNVSAVDRAHNIAELYNKSLKKNSNNVVDIPSANDSRFKDND